MLPPETSPDPKTQNILNEMKEAHENEVARLSKASAPILKELEAIGVNVGSISGLYHHRPLTDPVVQVLLRWLKPDLDEDILDGILSNLRHPKKKRFDGRPLANLFERTKSRHIRFAIGDVIDFAKPIGINEWIKTSISDPRFEDARLALTTGAASLLPPEEANPALIELFDLHPYAVSQALAISGGIDEIAFLERKALHLKGSEKKDIDRAIKRIKKRLRVL